MPGEGPLAILRGGGDLGTGVALRLHRAGWRVLITELSQPLVIRRMVAFATAVFEGSIEVEGTIGRRVDFDQIESTWAGDQIPVYVDPACTIAVRLSPLALIDAIMAKRNTGTRITDAPIVVALGPGFMANADCHAVIDTQRGHNLGRVYYHGSAEPNTDTPGAIGGQDSKRALRAPIAGVFYTLRKIGEYVQAGEVIGRVIPVDFTLSRDAVQRLTLSDRDASQPLGVIVKTQIGGVVRGVLADGLHVPEGTKVADVDPRGEVSYCFSVSDKSWAVGGGALEAVLYLARQSRINPP